MDSTLVRWKMTAVAEERTRPTIRELHRPVVAFRRGEREEEGKRPVNEMLIVLMRDGTLLACSRGFSMRRWRVDYESGEIQQLQTFRGHSSRIVSMKEMADGMVASLDEKDVRIWDLGSGKCLLRLPESKPHCILVPKHSNNVLIVSVGVAGLMKIYTFDRHGRVDSVQTERVSYDGGRATADMVELQSGLIVCYFVSDFRVMLWNRGTQSTVSLCLSDLHYMSIVELERDVIVTLEDFEALRVQVWDLAEEEGRGKRIHAFSLETRNYGVLMSFDKIHFPFNNQYAIVTAFSGRIVIGWNKEGYRLFRCETFELPCSFVSLNNGLFMTVGANVLEVWNTFEPTK